MNKIDEEVEGEKEGERENEVPQNDLSVQIDNRGDRDMNWMKVTLLRKVIYMDCFRRRIFEVEAKELFFHDIVPTTERESERE